MVRDYDPQALLRDLIARTRVSEFSIATPSLHDIFVRIAGNTEKVEAQVA